MLALLRRPLRRAYGLESGAVFVFGVLDVFLGFGVGFVGLVGLGLLGQVGWEMVGGFWEG